ncbi:MAG TPA: methyltransferase domain-containing protein [Solirubrobacterales bacterium]|nr:methyltransferase domain-containing protein [Solirubrobacterales bacterium]
MSATAVIWQDVECGGYDADLGLWEELAAPRGGLVLELGCGTGRVALHLARRGFEVVGLDLDSRLIEALLERAASDPAVAARVRALVADARDFALSEPVALALAPMQLLQLLPTRADRIACLRRVTAALEVGGLLAAAIVERAPAVVESFAPLPDVREVDGWVYMSSPVAVPPSDGRILLRRRRETVSPSGERGEEIDQIELRVLTAERLEDEAEEAGLRVVGRRGIPETEAHVGSTVVLLGRGA